MCVAPKSAFMHVRALVLECALELADWAALYSQTCRGMQKLAVLGA